MALNSMQDLFTEQVADLYSAEQQLVEALPKMAKAANDSQLKSAFEHHLEQTRNHVQRLEQVFEQMGMQPKTERCEAMEGLIKEGEEVIQMDGAPAVKDIALIAAAQRVEHYEISGYGTLRTVAESMEMGGIRDLLDKTLQEEGETDHKLTSLTTGGLLQSGIKEGAPAAD